MKLKYYGTGAGYGIPEIFCNCRICQHARLNGGKDIRTRSLAVLDDCLAIDFSVDAFHHNAFSGLNMQKIHDVLITHNHHDHLFLPDIFTRAKNMLQPVNFYVSEKSGKDLFSTVNRFENDFNNGVKDPEQFTKVKAHSLEFFKPINILDYTITPLKANHAHDIDAVIFVICSKDKNVLWAHDTGLFCEDTMDWIKNSGIIFDLVSLDCTLKKGAQITKAHMDLDWCLQTANALRKNKNANQNTKFIISHIGHLVDLTHEELEMEAARSGFITAYDGLEIVF